MQIQFEKALYESHDFQNKSFFGFFRRSKPALPSFEYIYDLKEFQICPVTMIISYIYPIKCFNFGEFPFFCWMAIQMRQVSIGLKCFTWIKTIFGKQNRSFLVKYVALFSLMKYTFSKINRYFESAIVRLFSYQLRTKQSIDRSKMIFFRHGEILFVEQSPVSTVYDERNWCSIGAAHVTKNDFVLIGSIDVIITMVE